jgi:hypothetical protein
MSNPNKLDSEILVYAIVKTYNFIHWQSIFKGIETEANLKLKVD